MTRGGSAPQSGVSTVPMPQSGAQKADSAPQSAHPDGRPRGGTARTPGNKTPRKVQWAFDAPAGGAVAAPAPTTAPAPEDEADRGRSLARHTPDDSTHALDEHGLDPTAFKTLMHALERHRSSSESPMPRPPPPVLTIDPVDRPSTSTDQSHPATTISDEPFFDNNADHHTAFNEARSGSGSNSGSASTPDTPSEQPRSPVNAGGREHFIDPRESHGLPHPEEYDLDRDAEERARRVVRQHTSRRRWFGGGGMRRRKKESPEARTDVEREADADGGRQALLGTGAQLRGRGGGGVLSTLLSLYDNQVSGLTSGASTPGWMTPGTSTPARRSFERLTSQDLERPPEPEIVVEKPWTQDAPPQLPPPQHERRHSHLNIMTELPDGRDSSPQQSPSSPSSPTSQGRKSPSSLFALPRPRPQKTSSGTLGALIASTGNISGAAAPVNSTLAPNFKRPGYHLSRYSLESAPTKDQLDKERTATLRRANSAHFGEKGSPHSSSSTETSSPEAPAYVPRSPKKKWTGVLTDLESAASSFANLAGVPAWKNRGGSGSGTPGTTDGGDEWLDEKRLGGREGKERERRRKRKKAEIYITRHVAQIIQRQEFILKLARAMMMFGGPSHRLQAQIQSTARVLDIELSCLYLPDVMLISFDDSGTGTSNIKFIRQASSLDLGKLQDAHLLYWKVIHDELSVSEASSELDRLMLKKQLYRWWQVILIGGLCSASICSVSFNGSFIDSIISIPLGGLLVAVQLLSVRNELYSNVFEITIATLLSFISAALAATDRFCYTAVASSSVVLILPGFIVLCGSLEISSRNIVSGAVRLCFALMYSLFLGFGLAIGAEMYIRFTNHGIHGSTDYTCSWSHRSDGPWWQRSVSGHWAFLTVPSYSLFLSMRNQAPWNRKELPILIIISCIGWVTNHFVGLSFQNHNDLSSAVGAFAVGLVSNIYAKFFSGNAFVVMITGILFQLPSGLGNGGLLTFAEQSTTASSTTSYLSGFQTALQLISVSIGLTVGLGISLVVVHPIQSRRRAGGVFSL